MSKKKDTGWRTRVSGSINQVGSHFKLEPHGDRSNLPKSLQQVSFGEISGMLAKRRRKGMTPEEIAEEEMIDQAVEEAIVEREQAEYQKNLLQKLGDAIDKLDKKNRLKKALDEAKAEQETYESESGDGYGEYQEDLEKKLSKVQTDNDLMG
jgi:molecular chaperone DnaK (HSP70)